MVKASLRKKAYHPRGPHKDGCQCVACKGKSVLPSLLTEPVTISEVKGFLTTNKTYHPTPPPPVRLDSLLNTAKFKLGGQLHRVGTKVEGMVVIYNLAVNDTATLAGSTMVEPVIE